jgi:hypothetical protein
MRLRKVALLKLSMNLGVKMFHRNVSTRVWISSKIIFIHQISNARQKSYINTDKCYGKLQVKEAQSENPNSNSVSPPAYCPEASYLFVSI